MRACRHLGASPDPSPPTPSDSTIIPYDWLVTIDAHGNALLAPGPSKAPSEPPQMSQHRDESVGPVASVPRVLMSRHRGDVGAQLARGDDELGGALRALSPAEEKGRAGAKSILAGECRPQGFRLLLCESWGAVVAWRQKRERTQLSADFTVFSCCLVSLWGAVVCCLSAKAGSRLHATS